MSEVWLPPSGDPERSGPTPEEGPEGLEGVRPDPGPPSTEAFGDFDLKKVHLENYVSIEIEAFVNRRKAIALPA